MKILALDPSTTHVGWCVAEGGRHIASGVFIPEAKHADDRLPAIYWWLLRTVTRAQPDVIAYEEAAGDHLNRRTDRHLAKVAGLIIAAGLTVSVKRFITVYPSQVKATKASKDNVGYAAAVAGKRTMGPDEADAIGVWLHAEGSLRTDALKARIKQTGR